MKQLIILSCLFFISFDSYTSNLAEFSSIKELPNGEIRITFKLSKVALVKSYALDDPSRIVIDLKDFQLKKELDSPGGLERAREQNPEFEILSKEQIYEKLKSGPEGFYKASSTMTLSMLALLLLATLNSIFVTVIYRRVVFKNVHRPLPPPTEHT